MSKTITIDYQDKKIEGELLEFKTKNEEWNKYETEDGSIVKVKVVVTKIIRANTTTKSGEPVYIINSTTLVDADVSDEIRAMYSTEKEETNEN